MSSVHSHKVHRQMDATCAGDPPVDDLDVLVALVQGRYEQAAVGAVPVECRVFQEVGLVANVAKFIIAHAKSLVAWA